MRVPRLTVVLLIALGAWTLGVAPASANTGPLAFLKTLPTPPEGFGKPVAIAIDQANGQVYVSDGANQIAVFSPTGEYLSMMTCGCGHVHSLAVRELAGGAAELYVADSADERIAVLNSKGEQHDWADAYGGDYEYVAVDNSKDPSDPSGGDVYVAASPAGESSHGEGRVILRAPSEAPVNFATSEPYSNGSELLGELQPGEFAHERYFEHFNEPERLAVNPANGDLYVSDMLRPAFRVPSSNARVGVFSPAGESLYSMPTTFPGAEPVGLAINGTSGEVYVGHHTPDFLDVFDYSGALEEQLTGTPSGR
jgi:DNA-binding beta-propeller fold protein YncE